MSSLQALLKNVNHSAPTEFDAEDQAFGHWQPSTNNNTAEPSDDPESSRAHYLNVDKSTLRKPGQADDDPKYAGKKVSRAQLFDHSPSSDQPGRRQPSSDEDEENDEEEEDENLPFGPVQDDSASDSESEASESADEEAQPPAAPTTTSSTAKRKAVAFQDTESQDAPQDEAQETQAMVSSLRQAASADVEKGQHVRKQLTCWDALLEMRIKLQKPLSLVNTLPSPENFEHYQCPELDEARTSLANLVEQISALRAKLASTNATYTPPSSSAKRRKIDTAEDVPPLADTLDRLQQHTAAANPFLESTVRKWSDKVNAASTASLKNKNKFSGGGANSAIFKNTWSAIEGALAADEGRLVERTKTLRSGTEAIGGGEPRTVFDDADFYQQLLRDVVDHQLLDPDDPSMRALQAAAQAKKPKKLVDTKASKGRKLRYHVHEKLQNFMVPMATATWGEQQTDELFRSLLGKGFEGHLQDGEQQQQEEEEAERAAAQMDGGDLAGLRIFG